MFTAFLSSLLSYLLVFAVFIFVIALALFIGISARIILNKKNAKKSD
jgi:hypothetical protein